MGLLAVPLLEDGDVGTTGDARRDDVAMGWLVAQLARTPGGTPSCSARSGSAALQGAIAIWQFHTGHQLNLYGGRGEAVFGSNYFFSFDDINRPTGGLEDPISLGNVLALGVPALLYTALTARTAARPRGRDRRRRRRACTRLTISLSRMSWFGAIAGVAVAVALLPEAGRRGRLGVALRRRRDGLVAMAAGGQALVDRFDTALAPTASSSVTAEGDGRGCGSGHAGRGPRARRTRRRRRIRGPAHELGRYGLDYGPFTHVHSTYLMLATCAGALGVMALLIVLGAMVPISVPGDRVNPIAASALAGVSASRSSSGSRTGHRLSAGRRVFAAVFGAAAGLARRVATRTGRDDSPSVRRARPDAHQQHHAGHRSGA